MIIFSLRVIAILVIGHRSSVTEFISQHDAVMLSGAKHLWFTSAGEMGPKLIRDSSLRSE
ncbi:MAG: hypothetical protein DME52_13230 [Verrucomicrobia bacterium]|nr:MAG: hypothetical protein DME84_09085 [Verrucomicrobiota bacterium]PYK23108.1 MAG: hypothetical protein DME52_13230 [Verrucomicrobiota bacterium]PYK50295.1 MAG: hypothetical protein DME51_06260 [Verrucomicrobiota bacterium]